MSSVKMKTMALPMRLCASMAAVAWQLTAVGQGPAPRDPGAVVIIKPARVFDGEVMHEGWAVRVRGDRIDAVDEAVSIAAEGARVIDLAGTTLLPGLIE